MVTTQAEENENAPDDNFLTPAADAEEKTLDAQYMTVSPEKAKEWLQRNEQNRNIRPDRVDRYAKLMRSGDQWMASPDAIAFDYNGRLVNGQHRLKALAQAGVEQTMLVAWNLHPDASMIADVGIKRTAADALVIGGYTKGSSQEMAAILRLVALWQRNELSRCGEYEIVDNWEITDLADIFSERVQETIDFVSDFKSELDGTFPRSMVGFAHFLYTPTYGNRPSNFVQAFAKGGFYQENWQEKFADDPEVDTSGGPEPIKDPARMLADKVEGSEYPREKLLAYLIKAMNWYCMEEPHKRLRWGGDEEFPKPAIDTLPELAEGPKEMPGVS